MNAEKKHQYFFLLGHVVLLLGLLCSKALISIGSVFIIGSAVWQIVLNPGLIASPPKPIVGFLMLFFIPFLSFFWSENMHDCLEVVLNKVMLPALAWSYWLAPKLDKREYFWLSVTNIGLVLAGTVYSIGHYLFSADYVNESYLRAKTLKVMYLNDHLQFSLWIIITLGLMLYDWQVLISYWRKYSKFVFGAIALWFMLFLHVLGAKTGLILLYAGLFYLFFQKGIGKISSFYKIMILPLTLGLLFLSYIFIPTFKTGCTIRCMILISMLRAVLSMDWTEEPGCCHGKQELRSPILILFWGLVLEIYMMCLMIGTRLTQLTWRLIIGYNLLTNG
jgi:hypothetical protein